MSRKHSIDKFSEVCNLLTSTEVNDALHKEKIYNQIKFKIGTEIIQNNYRKKGGIYMKKNFQKSIAIATLGAICLIGGLSTTAYGQEVIGSILAHFQVGGIEITQYDKELPKIESDSKSNKITVRESVPKRTTIEESRMVMEIDFAVPTWMPAGYTYLSSVMHSDNGVEVQYSKGEGLISLLISKGENGISTAGEVKKEMIGDKAVYFANGIVLWEQDGLNYELYAAQQDLDLDTLGKIIGTMVTGKAYNESPIYINLTGDQKASITVVAAAAAPQ